MQLVPVRDGYALVSEHSELVDWKYQPGPIVLHLTINSRKPLTYENRAEVIHEIKPVNTDFDWWRELVKEFKGCVSDNGRCPHMGGRIINGQCTAHGLCFRDDVVVSDFEVEFVGYEQIHKVHLKEGKFRIKILCEMRAKIGWFRHNGQRICLFEMSHVIPLYTKDILILGEL